MTVTRDKVQAALDSATPGDWTGDLAKEYLRLLNVVEAALDRLAASQFTNAEHRQAITILEAATKPETET